MTTTAKASIPMSGLSQDQSALQHQVQLTSGPLPLAPGASVKDAGGYEIGKVTSAVVEGDAIVVSMELDGLNQAQWFSAGIDAGWVSEPFCGSHDTGPSSIREKAAEASGDDDVLDMCRAFLRVWDHGEDGPA